MTYVADLHIHSPYARGTSRRLTFANLARWARLKGINLLASGDFTHPQWFEETRLQLKDAGNGLFQLDGVFFVLGTELSCVFRQGGRARRVHVLVFAPGLETVERINSSLAGHGRLGSDGRPILRLSPRDLLITLLDIDARCLVVPAHLWTPWYGLYGSKSGFGSLEECFGDVTHHVHAVETGLSSDPAMNWRVPSLDGVSIVSFSDAHSLPNLGRELTVFDGKPSYEGLAEALKTQRISHTIEFFPQEGKYHYSGHRKCGVRYSPEEVAARGRDCPRCGAPLTVGVMQRVEELGGRQVKTWTDSAGFVKSDNGRPPFKTLVMLREIIAQGLECGPDTMKATETYLELVSQFGSELDVLMQTPPSEIGPVAGDRVERGVARVRAGDIYIDPGYDGSYGKVQVFGPDAEVATAGAIPV